MPKPGTKNTQMERSKIGEKSAFDFPFVLFVSFVVYGLLFTSVMPLRSQEFMNDIRIPVRHTLPIFILAFYVSSSCPAFEVSRVCELPT